MKRSLLLPIVAAILAAAPSVQARTLSPEEALARALTKEGMHRLPTAQATIAYSLAPQSTVSKESTLYVFNRTDSTGYIVVSASDKTPALLGYSDSGPFRSNPAVDYWLSQYDLEITAVSSEDDIPDDTQTGLSDLDLDPIEPLMTTQWNQAAPYNDLCPVINGVTSPTGCVATAMAQVMNFHKWPEQGTGSISYSTSGQSLKLDFSTVTYDWADMIDVYDSSATAAEELAVATLMKSCGYSVYMAYGQYASGAAPVEIPDALTKYFNYSPDVQILWRRYYGVEEWAKIIYDQLENVGPVIYGGQSDDGGHCFVCDGYSTNGYFHFNWGWGGASDGYYLLTALNPSTQGIGGGSADGYNMDQDIIINIRPNDGTATAEAVYTSSSPFSMTTTSTRTGSTATFVAAVSNLGRATTDFYYVLRIKGDDGYVNYTSWPYTDELQLKPNYSYNSYSWRTQLPSSIPNGTYVVEPVVKTDDGEYHDINFYVGYASFATMTVDSGLVTFTNESTGLPRFTEVWIEPETIYAGYPFDANVDLDNEYVEEYYGTIYGALYKDANIQQILDPMVIDIDGSTTEEISYSTDVPDLVEPGTYSFGFVAILNGQYQLMSSVVDLEVETAPPSSSYKATKPQFVDQLAVDKNHISCSSVLTCTKGICYEPMRLRLIGKDENGNWITLKNVSAPTTYLTEGNSQQLNFSTDYPEGVEGGEYGVFIINKDGNMVSPINYFTFAKAATTAVDSVTIDSFVADEPVYDLAGHQVDASSLTPGYYVTSHGTILIR